MKISYLCVTHERPEFIPWLLWNFNRQTYPDKELVLVDSSEKPYARKRKGVRVIAAPGANVPAKRNIALSEARGDAFTWLDDDDWHHPGSVADLAARMVADEVSVSGGRVAWFVDLFTEQTKRLVMRRDFLFASMLVRMDALALQTLSFDETIEKGSDIAWLEQLLLWNAFTVSHDIPSLFLCHDRNLGNRAKLHQFNRTLDDPRGIVGSEAWGDTDKQLAQLRKRLGN